MPPWRGVAFKAYLRAVTNVAMGFGALVGGLTLWLDATWAYLAVRSLKGRMPANSTASPPR